MKENKPKRKSSKSKSYSSKNSDNFIVELLPIQKEVINLHIENDIVLLTGAPGTGKDFMQIYRAVSGLIQKEFEEVIFMRTAIEATSTKLGYLKGDEQDKLQPYLEIFYDQLSRMLNRVVYERMKSKVRFEYPGFVRGKTFGGSNKGNVCIILTEAQNCTLHELVTISTRLADGSKLFINGDVNQSDIGNKSGLRDFLKITSNIEGVFHKELGAEFQMRGRLAQEIGEAYDKFINKKKQ